MVGELKFRDLWLARADAAVAQRLAQGRIVVPRWSPDGSKIASTDDAETISVIDVHTGETTVVAEFGGFPDWVDDPTLIVDTGD